MRLLKISLAFTTRKKFKLYGFAYCKLFYYMGSILHLFLKKQNDRGKESGIKQFSSLILSQVIWARPTCPEKGWFAHPTSRSGTLAAPAPAARWLHPRRAISGRPGSSAARPPPSVTAYSPCRAFCLPGPRSLTFVTSRTWSACLITWQKRHRLWNTSACWGTWRVPMSWWAWRKMRKTTGGTGVCPRCARRRANRGVSGGTCDWAHGRCLAIPVDSSWWC